MKKILSLLLCGTMIFSLAACGEKTPVGSDAPSTEAPAVSAGAADVDFLPDNETDLAEKLLGFSNQTTLLTVNGEEVSAEKYLYWLGNMTAYYSYVYSMYGGSLDLEAEMGDGSTYGDAMKQIAHDNCLLLAVTPALAQEFNVALDEEDMAKLISEREEDITSAGSEEEYAKNLQAMGISDRVSFELSAVTELYDKVKEACTKQTAESLSAEEMNAYIEENDLLGAKHILLLTTDPTTGEEYDDDAKAEAKAKAQEILEQLKQGGDFDALMQEYSEDSGLESYPDGYTFSAGEMVAEFEDATRALEIGAFTQELVESPYGYHIILRQSADTDETRQEAAEEKFNTMVQEKMDSAEVVVAAEYDSFTAGDYYNKLLEYQNELLAEEDAADSELESAEPSQAPDAEDADE